MTNLQIAQNIINAHFGRILYDAAQGIGDYAEFKDRTVAELYDAVVHDIRELDEEE